VPHLRRPGSRGDLHLLVEVEIPTRLTDRQRELLEELARESGEQTAAGDAEGVGAGPRTRHGKRTLGDRIKDAIS
jgi:DnaJ-class molecular chaperone